MSRIVFILLLLFTFGCFNSSAVQNREEIINVGDFVDDVKHKLRKWGAQEAHFAFAIAVKSS